MEVSYMCLSLLNLCGHTVVSITVLLIILSQTKCQRTTDAQALVPAGPPRPLTQKLRLALSSDNLHLDSTTQPRNPLTCRSPKIRSGKDCCQPILSTKAPLKGKHLLLCYDFKVLYVDPYPGNMSFFPAQTFIPAWFTLPVATHSYTILLTMTDFIPYDEFTPDCNLAFFTVPHNLIQ